MAKDFGKRTAFGAFGDRPKRTDAERAAYIKSLKGTQHRAGRAVSNRSGITPAERQAAYGKFGGSDRPSAQSHGTRAHERRSPGPVMSAKGSTMSAKDRSDLNKFLDRAEARTGGATPGRPDKAAKKAAPRKAAKAAPRKAAKASSPRKQTGTPRAVQARNVRVIPRPPKAVGRATVKSAPAKATGRAAVKSGGSGPGNAVARRSSGAVAARGGQSPQVVQGRPISTRQAAQGGAAAGAARAGAAAGAVQARSERKAAKRAARKTGSGPARRLLVAELIVSLLVVGLSPLTDKHKDEPPAVMVKRLTAVSALYLILGLVSTGGRGAARVAAAFGGVVTLTLLVSDRDVLSVVAARFNAPPPQGPAGPDPVGAAGTESGHEEPGPNGPGLDSGGGIIAPTGSRSIAPGGIAPPGGFA